MELVGGCVDSREEFEELFGLFFSIIDLTEVIEEHNKLLDVAIPEIVFKLSSKDGVTIVFKVGFENLVEGEDHILGEEVDKSTLTNTRHTGEAHTKWHFPGSSAGEGTFRKLFQLGDSIVGREERGECNLSELVSKDTLVESETNLIETNHTARHSGIELYTAIGVSLKHIMDLIHPSNGIFNNSTGLIGSKRSASDSEISN